jgi:hypothetical protein
VLVQSGAGLATGDPGAVRGWDVDFFLLAMVALTPVPYDCGFVSIAEARCEASPEWIVELEQLGAAFLEPGELSLEQCRRTDAALDRALKADLSKLTVVERVVAQNGALRAFGPKSCERHVAGGVSKKAAQVVLRLALPSKALSELGSDAMTDVEEWLGPHASWVDRKTEQEMLHHDTMEFFTQSFRPVRSRSMRAVVSQMIAVDRDGRVHVTPIIGRIEARDGEGLEAPACVGKLDARRLRCARGRIQPVPEERLPENDFVHRSAPGFVDCNRCHEAADAHANLIDLLPEDRAQLERRRAGFLEEAERTVRTIIEKAK